MNEREKKEYLERYNEAKEKGVPFFPNIVFKDAIVSLIVFLILAALAYFVGVPMEARANPADANYTPRPEWYFLFLFQLLKYFPGQLEFIGAMLLPGLFILLLLALPFLDRNPRRHFTNRPLASGAAVLVVVGIIGLTVLSIREAPPPQIEEPENLAARLYAQNCANCHGADISVPAGTDLHRLIAEGRHEGMPAWGGDLSTDEIDALAGFVTSPSGSTVYTRECSECHRDFVLASGNPQELQRVVHEGREYPAHAQQDVPVWSERLPPEELNALLNFMAAPDGQRLFEMNCSACHGAGLSYAGDEASLRQIISQGGRHLEMPAWQATLSEDEIDKLAAYVTDPQGRPAGNILFGQHCAACHGERVPSAPDMVTARKVIRGGGGHVTMPVWGEILTTEQLDALVRFTLGGGGGGGAQEGARLFAANCAVCHGQFGQGGPNPAQAGDLISPISSSEYLATRDDTTIRNVISQGQPELGMSPFSAAFGGELGEDEIDSLVDFIRGWQANPPEIAAPPTPTTVPPSPQLTADRVYEGLCAQCHGSGGEGGSGPALNTAEFQARYEDADLAEIIRRGVESTPMIGVGELLSEEQIRELVELIRAFGSAPISGPPRFGADVLPILESRCQVCHGASTKLGGWDASTYDAVMSSGDSAPVIISGDPEASLLADMLRGDGVQLMPPGGSLARAQIDIILAWIAAGAENN